MMARLSMLSLLNSGLDDRNPGARSCRGTSETVFAMQPGGIACFARYYDRSHLQAHPRQKVASIEIDMTPTNPDGESYSSNHAAPRSGKPFRPSHPTCFISSEGRQGRAFTV